MYQVAIICLVLPWVESAIPVNEVEEDGNSPYPYTFGYKVHDKDGDQWRTEISDGHGRVEGTYGFFDNSGLKREVEYIADDDGFRAKINTNEPGMDMPSPADILLNADPPADYDAAIYGIEALPEVRSVVGAKERPAREQQRSHEQSRSQSVKSRIIDLPTRADPKAFYKYQRFADNSVPPIYVVDGHLQSPWFPMKSRP